MNVFDFKSSSEYLNAYFDKHSANQRGLKAKLAEAAGIFSSYFSLVLAGKRPLNLEQASGICDFLNFTTAESRYFFRLVELDRVSESKLKKKLLDEVEDMRKEHIKISSRVKVDQVSLAAEDYEKFYSSWLYIAVRLMTAIPQNQTISQIAKSLNTSEKEVEQVVQFLLNKNLIKYENKKLAIGPTHMHLDVASPLVKHHHSNWRLRAIEKYNFFNHSQELAYSFVTCLSVEDAEKIRTKCLELIQGIRKISDPSPSEKLYCLNMDWFQV